MNKLYRSCTDRKIAGVCGGLGKHLNIDPTIIRLLGAVSVICCGFGIILYILAVLIIPDEQQRIQ